MPEEVKQKCFVIMPFDQTIEEHTKEYWDNHYEKFLEPLIESGHPLKAERSTALRGDILRQIITDLVTASIVVADLTDANPNVYWELGIRQSFKHGTVTIAEDGTKLPFDLGAKGTLFYFPKDHIKMQEFGSKFHEVIVDCLKNPDLPDSHVLETISGRGTLYQVLTRDETIRKFNALISEIERNEGILKGVMETCKENIERRKKKEDIELVTSRFRCPAVELLIVSRYVDADEEFYETAESYFDNLLQVNDQLSIWETSPKPTEKWFLKTSENFEAVMKKLHELITKHVKEIETVL